MDLNLLRIGLALRMQALLEELSPEAMAEAMAEVEDHLHQSHLEISPDQESPEKFARSLFLEGSSVGRLLALEAQTQGVDPTQAGESPTDLVLSLLPSGT